MRHPEDGSGFRCYECGQVFPSMWGDTCNACREKERRHKEMVAATMAAAPQPVAEGELWSLIRRVLLQGHAQQEDYRAGKYNAQGGYEAFSANVDHAARARVPQFLALLHPAAPAPAGPGKEGG